MNQQEMSLRIVRLEKLVGTLAQFANENLNAFEDWCEDNKDLDDNVLLLANFVDNFYEHEATIIEERKEEAKRKAFLETARVITNAQ